MCSLRIIQSEIKQVREYSLNCNISSIELEVRSLNFICVGSSSFFCKETPNTAPDCLLEEERSNIFLYYLTRRNFVCFLCLQTPMNVNPARVTRTPTAPTHQVHMSASARTGTKRMVITVKVRSINLFLSTEIDSYFTFLKFEIATRSPSSGILPTLRPLDINAFSFVRKRIKITH